MPELSGKIRVHSFDFDGCIFHRQYKWQLNDQSPANQNQVITVNQSLLDNIKLQRPDFDREIVFIGSMRQSERLDDHNAYDPKRLGQTTESCFIALQKISCYLDATLDDFLLDDVFHECSNGASFKTAIARYSELCPPFYQNKKYSMKKLISDETKLTILYAQMHKIAIQHPDHDIFFDFYDDKGWPYQTGKILDKLHGYFNEYSELIPCNITLRLNQYHGEAVSTFPVIQGTGKINQNYQNTVREMVSLAAIHYREGNRVNVIPHVVPSMLTSINSVHSYARMGLFNSGQNGVSAVIASEKKTDENSSHVESVFTLGK